MSTVTFDNGRFARKGMAGILLGLLGRFRHRLHRYLVLSRAQRELERLDDRLLSDIGITRGDIRRTVWGENNERSL